MKLLTALIVLGMSLLLSGCRQHSVWKQEGPFVWEDKSPTPPTAQKKMGTVVIDAGHGGKDHGTHSEKHHYHEKHLTLLTARLVQQYLEEMGYETILTRDADTFVELSKRAQLANALNANLFVSIHYNFSDSPEADGIEVFYFKSDTPNSRLVASKALGQEVLSRILKHTGANSRGLKTANFAVIRETQMPAILIEGGFLSNPNERAKIKDPDYRCYLAWAIARGVDAYLANK